MDQKTFTQQIAYLSAAYEREVRKETAAVYWHQLSSLPDEPFIAAVAMHVAESRFFPTVAELRQLTRTAMQRTGPTLLSTPNVSTEAVLRQHARLIGVDEEEYLAEHMQR